LEARLDVGHSDMITWFLSFSVHKDGTKRNISGETMDYAVAPFPTHETLLHGRQRQAHRTGRLGLDDAVEIESRSG